GAGHGTRYVFAVPRAGGGPVDLELDDEPAAPARDTLAGAAGSETDLELHWTSPVNVGDTRYSLTGCVRRPRSAEVRYGGAGGVPCVASGLGEEVFLDHSGSFVANLELQADADNALEVPVCDNLGRARVRIPACVRPRSAKDGGDDPRRSLGLGVLP